MQPSPRSLAGLVTQQYHVTLSEYCGGLRQHWHTHESAILTLNLAGVKREAVTRDDRVIGPLEVGVKPPGIRHTDDFGPDGVRSVRIAFDATMADHWCVFTQWNWRSCPAAARALVRVADGLLRRLAVAEIDGDLHEAVAALMPAQVPGSDRTAPAWLVAARERICDEGGSPALGALAAQAGLHPVHFAKQFRRFFGTSVGDFRQLVRATRAAAMLGQRQASLAAIASLAGYVDQPHMTHRFRAAIGVTPSRFRALIRDLKPSERTRRQPLRR